MPAKCPMCRGSGFSTQRNRIKRSAAAWKLAWRDKYAEISHGIALN